MQQQLMPFGWPLFPHVPVNPLDDIDIINYTASPQPGPPGPPGQPGSAGVGVDSAVVEPNPGDLIITLTDGTVINAGNVIGPPGPPGPPGPGGSCICQTTNITDNYTATEKDCYIGVQLKEKATLTLPNNVPNGTRYTVKLEFGAPVGNRKLTLEPQSPALINGVTAITLTTPYESISVIYNNQNWWTV